MSRKTQLLIGFILLLGGLVQAQIPLPVSIEKNTDGRNAQLACTPGFENFAGTVSIGTTNAASNDIDLDTMFLCINDMVDIIHNGDQMLTGDPDNTTDPGICYGFYNCVPTVSGPADITTIETDPCLVPNPIPAPGSPTFLVINEGSNLNGDITLNNTGFIQTNFNSGNPIMAFFSPLTYDALNDLGGGNFIPTYENGGPCVHSNIDTAFAVVYLNEITVEDIELGPLVNLGNCSARFNLLGGLPEFDSGETYTISATLNSNPSVEATINTSATGHNEMVKLSVPQAGLYDVTVEDGKGCPLSFQLDMSACSETITLNIDPITTEEGATVCVPVTADDFSDIVSFQFVISYDPNVLNVSSPDLANINPAFAVSPPFGAVPTEGNYLIGWAAFPPVGVNLPNGGTLFEICFDVVGSNGDQTDINLIDLPTFPFEFANSTGNVSPLVNPGLLTIGSNNSLDLDLTGTNETCLGLNNGSLSALAVGGNAPFEFTCVNSSGTFNDNIIIVDPTIAYTLNGLVPGEYTVTVTENAGAGPLTVQESITILPGIELAIIIDPEEGPCFGDPGDISATPALNGASIPFPYPPNYSIEWSNGSTDFELFNVPSGVFYSVTLTDTDNMCSVESTDLLSQPTQINLNLDNVVDATCSGIPNGSLEISVSGGTTTDVNNTPLDPSDDLTYSIELQDINGNTITTVNNGTLITANNLVEGDYTCIAIDQNNCTYSEVFSVGATTSLQLNLTAAQDVNCFGDCDAFLTVEAQTIGGVSVNYDFDWGSSLVSVDGATTSTVSNLCVGSYTLVLTDPDLGCSTQATYDISEPTELTASVIDVQNESCDTGSDGSITVEATGGTPNYSYDWGILGQTNSTATNLVAGTYEVTITDDNNCEVILMEDILQPTPPTVTMDDFTLECNGDNNGVLVANAIGTVNPISLYSWSTNNSGIALNTETNLAAGIYTVTVEDVIGCTATATAEVIAPPALTIANLIPVSPTCPGLSDGELAVQVTGGSGSYNYIWSNNNTNAVNTGLSAGSYSVTISDANTNCPEITGTEDVLDPPSIDSEVFNITDVSCANAVGIDCDGEAEAIAALSDGTFPADNFTFTWLPSGQTSAPNSISSSANTLCAGTNFLVVSSTSCKDTIEFEVGAPAPLDSSFDIVDVSCLGFSDGTITVQGQGGTGPYTYLWDNNEITPERTDLAVGTYQVTITDDKDCTLTSVAEVEGPNSALQADIDLNTSSINVSCFGEADANVSILASGGNVSQGNIQYVWGSGISASITSSSAFGLSAGTFAVTVVDNQGCEFPLTFDIGSPDPVTFNIPEIDDILCPGGTTTVTVDTATGGNGLSNLFYTFSIDGGAPQTLGTFIEVFPGDHIVTVTDISDDACAADTTFFIEGLTESILSYPNPVEIELGASLEISPTIAAFNNPLDPATITWTPSEYLSFQDDLLEPTVAPLDNTIFLVEAFDINGCYVAAELIVEVDKNRNIYIPNIFTPNGDGFNSIFQPIAGVGVKSVNYFRVYDRWGSMLHERLNVAGTELTFENPAVAWDGKYKGKEVEQGVYVYLAEVEFLDGRVLLYRGDVTLAK